MIIWDNFSYYSVKPYVVTPHLNCLVETVQMRGHNLWLTRRFIFGLTTYGFSEK